MPDERPERDRLQTASRAPDPSTDGLRPLTGSADPVPADAATVELLRRLLSLPTSTARRIRAETPRRRARRPQTGPALDL